MSWQVVPALAIICGCFTTTGLLLKRIDIYFFGRHRRTRIREYEHQLDIRDWRISQARLQDEAKKH